MELTLAEPVTRLASSDRRRASAMLTRSAEWQYTSNTKEASVVRSYLPPLHKPKVQDALASAGMSRRSELSPDRIERAQEIADGLEFATESARYQYIMYGDAQHKRRERRSRRENRKEDGMPSKTKGRSRSRKASGGSANGRASKFTKAVVTHVAKLRREGATWKDVYAYLGGEFGNPDYRSTSTQVTKKLEEFGFDKFGRQGGKGKSKARGRDKPEGAGPSAAVKRTKATGTRKRSRAKASGRKRNRSRKSA